MPSISDNTFDGLGDLLYTGSLADRTHEFLKDQSGLDHESSIADMLRELDLPGFEVIDLEDFEEGEPEPELMFPAEDLFPSDTLYPDEAA